MDDEHDAGFCAGDHFPNQMLSVAPSQDNTILLHAAPQTEMANYNKNDNVLQGDSLLIHSYNSGPKSICMDESHEHDVFISYKECLRNHAASVGGYAIDGCGEFMASGNGKEGATPDALKCSACNCHRNFHKRMVQCDLYPVAAATHTSQFKSIGDHRLRYTPPGLDRMQVQQFQYEDGSKHGSEERFPTHHLGATPPSRPTMKKRLRRSFSNEHKEKILEFGKRVGWKIQRQDEADVQQLCEEKSAHDIDVLK